MDKQSTAFNTHWEWWIRGNKLWSVITESRADVAMGAAASAWNAGVDWGRKNPNPYVVYDQNPDWQS